MAILPAFAILAEDNSDKEFLSIVLRRYYQSDNMTIKGKGYGGCSEMLRKGQRDVEAWLRKGVGRFVICHDADKSSPDSVYTDVIKRIVQPAGLERVCCIVVPVEEIEAWVIADEEAVRHVIPTFLFKGHHNPETISDPKEWLIAKSRAANGKPLYSPATFNPAVARHLRLDVVAKKCQSFTRFLGDLDFLR